MGRTWNCNGTEIIIPEGVEVRTGSDRAPAIGIRFSYKGVRCREWSLSAANPKTASDNIKLAQAKLVTITDEIQRGVFKYGEHFPESKRCRQFGEFSAKGVLCKHLFDAYETWVRTKVEAVSADYYVNTLARHVRPTWDGRPVAMLTAPNIVQWLKELAETGMVLKSARNVKIPFSCALDLAVGDGKLPHNAFAGIKLGSVWPKQQRKSAYQVKPFNAKERAAIVKACETPEEADMMLIWFWGGYREEELIALRWSDVDMDNDRVRVQRVNSRGNIEERTKTDSSNRWVPFIGPAKAAWKRQQARTRLQRHGFVFQNPRTGERYGWTQSLSNEWFPNLLKRAGVAHRGPNQSRHTFASLMLQTEGVQNIATWSKILGHKDVEVTLRCYARLIDDETANSKHGFKLTGNYSQVAA